MRIKRMLKSRFTPHRYCLARQGTRSVSDYAFEFGQFYGCKYYYEPEEDIVMRFVMGLGLQIQQKMSIVVQILLYSQAQESIVI